MSSDKKDGGGGKGKEDGGKSKDAGSGKGKDDASSAGSGSDDDEGSVVIDAGANDEGALRRDITDLHRFLSRIDVPAIRADYERKRLWRLRISDVSFVNNSDGPLNVFLGFVLTDDTPPSSGVAAFVRRCLPAGGAGARELRSRGCYTPAVRGVAPSSRVYYPSSFSFADTGASGVVMSYRDITKRSLIVEVWEHRAYGAHVLLASATARLASVVHSQPTRELSLQRNVAAVARGRSPAIGTIIFSSVVEEAQLSHRLSLTGFSVALANALLHPSYRHPASCALTAPCFCSGCTCCSSAAAATDALQRWGYGESLSVDIGCEGARVAAKPGGRAGTRSRMRFSTPLNGVAMAAAASTPSHRILAKGGEPPKPSDAPVNDSMSYAELKLAGGSGQNLVLSCSRSHVSGQARRWWRQALRACLPPPPPPSILPPPPPPPSPFPPPPPASSSRSSTWMRRCASAAGAASRRGWATRASLSRASPHRASSPSSRPSSSSAAPAAA